MSAKASIFVIFLCTVCVFGQDADVSNHRTNPDPETTEPGITKSQAAKILQELQTIRMLLESQKILAPQGQDTVIANGSSNYTHRSMNNLGIHIMGNDKGASDAR